MEKHMNLLLLILLYNQLDRERFFLGALFLFTVPFSMKSCQEIMNF